MTRRVGYALSGVAVFAMLASVALFATSHIRIVRLSYVDGAVEMDRSSGHGLERAILNTPVVEGAKVVTGDGGLTEIEFENGSDLRMAENSEIKFRALSMNDAGEKLNEIEVAKGMVYFDVRPKKGDLFRVVSDGATLLLRHDTEMRLIAGERLRVSVFKGKAELENQPRAVTLKKKETLTFDAAHPADFLVAKDIEKLPTDRWNKERGAYQDAYAYNGGAGPGSGYGLADLNYYGSYFYAPGFGMLWQPYGLMSGWNPYSNGAWMFYSGMGYTWASSYPWGWLPYHYGSWVFSPGFGWAWAPGSAYRGTWYANSFQPSPVIARGPTGWRPVTPPVASAGIRSPAPTVAVGQVRAASVLPQGRPVPNFRSVIVNRAANMPAVANRSAVAAKSTFQARPAASMQSATVGPHGNAAAIQAHGPSGHVFARPAAVGGPEIGGPARGGFSPGAAAGRGSVTMANPGRSAGVAASSSASRH